jgi:hypothetical protein
MRAKLKQRCRSCLVAENVGGCLFGCNKQERIVRQLDVLVRESHARQENTIEEQLKRCPQAFKAGELLEKIFDRARHGNEENADYGCVQAPAEAIIPPFA